MNHPPTSFSQKTLEWLNFSLRAFVILSTALISISAISLSLKLYNHHAIRRNPKKNLFLCLSLLALSSSYCLYEFLTIAIFDKVEIMFRDLLFLLCFYFFFLDLIPVSGNRMSFYVGLGILGTIQAISCADLVERILQP